MNSIETIKDQKRNLRKDIDKRMRGLVEKFKEYVSVDTHVGFPKHLMIEGIWYRNNFGYKDGNYYCYLPEFVEFIHRYKIWKTDIIIYNENSNWWYVYNTETKKQLEFNELDTDAQIKMLELLENRLENKIV
jgi:hypothetical protein